MFGGLKVWSEPQLISFTIGMEAMFHYVSPYFPQEAQGALHGTHLPFYFHHSHVRVRVRMYDKPKATWSASWLRGEFEPGLPVQSSNHCTTPALKNRLLLTNKFNPA